MKVLSVRQPWADLIVRGVKDIENRSWATSYRGPLLIHASTTLMPGEAVARYYGPDHEWELGGIVGVVELVDCVTDSPSPWASPGSVHWVVRTPQRVPFFPCKGKLNVYDMPWPPSGEAMASAQSQQKRRDERPATEPMVASAATPPVRLIAAALSPERLAAVARACGVELPQGSDAIAAFEASFEGKLHTVLHALELSELSALLTSFGGKPRKNMLQSVVALENIIVYDAGAAYGREQPDGELVVETGIRPEPGWHNYIDQYGALCSGRLPEDFNGDDIGFEEFVERRILQEGLVPANDGYLYSAKDDGQVWRVPNDNEDGEEVDPNDDFHLEGTAELVARHDIRREAGFFYFLDQEGNVMRCPEGDTDNAEVVSKSKGQPLDPNYLYFVDSGLDVARIRRRRRHQLPIDAPLVWEVLEGLGAVAGRQSLVELCDRKGAPRRRSVEDLATELARVYKGDLRTMLADLRVDDLRLLAEDGFSLGDTLWTIADAATMEDSELRSRVQAMYCELNPAGWVEVADDDADDETAGAEDVDDGEHADELADLRSWLADQAKPEALTLRQLLEHAGLGSFSRLRSDRFQQLRAMVDQMGWAITDLEGRAFAAEDGSPGIDARVRLRQKGEPPPAATPEPASVVQAPATTLAPEPPPSDYEIVAARLRVLTAQPGGLRPEGWSAEAVEIACDRVLPDGQRMLLKKMAEKLSAGIHDIDRDVALLRDHLDRGAKVALVDAFELLGGDRPRREVLRSGLLANLGP